MLKQIGRYQIDKLIGKGGYGRVYLAFDERLDRRVAIKVPIFTGSAAPSDFQAQLREARTAANLDHPNIVPVYDVGSCRESPFYVVSKYIDGSDLAAAIARRRMPCREVAQLVAIVADALHHAHKAGIVHRDMKPGNILLDASGNPYVTDFGVALCEETLGKGPKYVGTPAYMSPEQARGEGHRVDGRSDVFSLGAVLYEMLIGRPPFRADSRSELLEQIVTFEPRPLRQQDDGIPRELERICFKALSKRASERHMTARDLAEDLRHYLAQEDEQGEFLEAHELETLVPSSDDPHETAIAALRSNEVAGGVTQTASGHDTERLKIVPKGLRSFDEHDADFFVQLLPGPRDRDGLPDSLRFWKTRIEESDGDKTFSVGLIYGPSGCGKSSLVKAGLLPRLAPNVSSIYVEATAVGAEAHLLNKLRKLCAFLPDNLSLKDTMALLRRERSAAPGEKVLVVVDQLEQWLHTWGENSNAELVDALRQCDGSGVQCLLLVRDDFWMAVTRFMRCLEIRLVEGENSAAVDLFQPRHAERILSAFGYAFGDLPEHTSDATPGQRAFLQQAIQGLAEDGKVVCVRLALFAEMMKGKAWTPATLQHLGGTSGVGVKFLDETFEASTAPPEHRYHQKTARAVLAALLPESGSDIKGHLRSYHELRQAIGEFGRAEDFDDLIRILDSELRLITPADPIGVAANQAEDSKRYVAKADSDAAHGGQAAAEKFYQLTHDYLVPSLRQWLTRKQRETYRGRAELRLTERSAAWNAKPENRQLPSWLEYMSIRLWTQPSRWKDSQKRMMDKARGIYSARAILCVALLILFSVAGLAIWNGLQEQRRSDYASSLVRRLVDAEMSQVPLVVREIDQYREWANPMLRRQADQAPSGSIERLHLSLALLPIDGGQVEYLRSQLLQLEPGAISVVRTALLPHRQRVVQPLWRVLLDSQQDPQHRFRAACALTALDQDNSQWSDVADRVTGWLVSNLNQSPRDFDVYLDLFEPVRDRLVPALVQTVRDQQHSDSQHELAVNVLVEYASDQPRVLADVLVDAPASKFDLVLNSLQSQSHAAAQQLVQCLADPGVGGDHDNASEATARRQAHAAIALLRMDRPDDVWPLLRHRSDPLSRSYFIEQAGDLGVDPETIVNRLENETDMSVRRALVLCLGEFQATKAESIDRDLLAKRLLQSFRTGADAGLHGALRWLLRQWGHQSSIEEIEQELQVDELRRQVHDSDQHRGWYVTSEGHTMIILEAPSSLLDLPGTTESEASSCTASCEQFDGRVMRHRFALAAQEVTRAQFDRFIPPEDIPTKIDEYSFTPDSPHVAMTWYGAAAYCNWLSSQEGIPEDQWCYLPNDKSHYDDGMRAKPDFLKLSGYRLPLESEWEFACRAGASTSRYYGDTSALLPKYAWYQDNSENHAWPVAMLKPNDFGLFDMHGNAWEWCHDRYLGYEGPLNTDPMSLTDDAGADESDVPEQNPRIEPVVSDVPRRLCGGGFRDQRRSITADERDQLLPGYRSLMVGFRPVRSLP